MPTRGGRLLAMRVLDPAGPARHCGLMSENDSGLRTLLGGGGEGSETTGRAALAQVAFERIGIFSAVFGFALLLIKIMRVSHLNSRTGHALLSKAGPVEIVRGALVTHFPTILFVVALLLTWWATGSFAVVRSLTPAHLAVGAVILFAIILLPWPFTGVLFAVGSLHFPYRISRPAGRRHTGYYLIIGAAAILLISDSEPWLPPEVFVLEDGSEVLGFALAEAETSTGWVVVLTQADRSVVHLRESAIEQREPCHLPDADRELEKYPSLFQVVIRESSDLPEPDCPT